MRIPGHVFVLCLILVLCACSNSLDVVQDPSPEDGGRIIPNELLAQLPPIAAGHQTSIVISQHANGVDRWDASLDAHVIATDLQLESEAGVLCWAMWLFIPGPSTPQSLNVALDGVGGGVAYIAIADYSQNRWEFVGSFSGDTTIPLDPARHKAPTGALMVAAMTWDGDVATISSLELKMDNGWTGVQVETGGVTGEQSSMALIGGRPAIAFMGTGTGLSYIRAANSSGTTWGDVDLIDADAVSGVRPSLLEVNGMPAVCYASGDKLAYRRAQTVNGMGWAGSYPDTAGQFSHISLAMVDMFPAVSYYDHTPPRGLHYVRAADFNGAGAWGTPQAIAPGDSRGLFSSLAVQDGNPIISFYDGFLGNLYLVGATDSTGSSWNPVQPVDAGVANAGLYASGAIVAGGMAISYHDALQHSLYYTYYSIPATEWQKINVDWSADTGYYTSLAVIDGNPAIAYYDQGRGMLKYVRAHDAKGSDWGLQGEYEIVDDVGDPGWYPTLIEVNGGPAICYYESNYQVLRYAVKNP